MSHPAPRPFRRAALAALVLGACASGIPYDVDFDASVGVAELVLRGDGKLMLDGEERPFEEAVASLEERAAAMSAKERDGFVVQLRAAPANASREVMERVGRDRELLLDRLSAMDLKQIAIVLKTK